MKHKNTKNKKNRSKLLIWVVSLVGFSLFLFYKEAQARDDHQVLVRSVDTMKYSRDRARTNLKDKAFQSLVDRQIENIAKAGATHIAIATPYDEEFLPTLKYWVTKSRKYKLKIWFRGNLAGWEGWFDYPKINRATHTKKIEEFILKNKDLFVNGDIFTSCPECENGGPGDPRYGDLTAYRQFLISEYSAVKSAFRRINRNVIANYYSMNGDVARLVMDKATTRTLGGVVTIDHYVASPKALSEDISSIAHMSGGSIVLGELGAPIPDIHGVMSEEEQALWMAEAFMEILKNPKVRGVNYWVSVDGSTEIWNASGEARLAADVLEKFYKGSKIKGKITDSEGKKVPNAKITTLNSDFISDINGEFTVPYLIKNQEIEVSAESFSEVAKAAITEDTDGSIVLSFNKPLNIPQIGLWQRILAILNYPIFLLNRLLTKV